MFLGQSFPLRLGCGVGFIVNQDPAIFCICLRLPVYSALAKDIFFIGAHGDLKGELQNVGGRRRRKKAGQLCGGKRAGKR